MSSQVFISLKVEIVKPFWDIYEGGVELYSYKYQFLSNWCKGNLDDNPNGNF